MAQMTPPQRREEAITFALLMSDGLPIESFKTVLIASCALLGVEPLLPGETYEDIRDRGSPC